MESTSDGSILTSTWCEVRQPDKTSGDEWGPHIPPTPIVWDEKSGSLLQVEVSDSAIRNVDDIELETSLLSMCERFSLVRSLDLKTDAFLGILD